MRAGARGFGGAVTPLEDILVAARPLRGSRLRWRTTMSMLALVAVVATSSGYPEPARAADPIPSPSAGSSASSSAEPSTGPDALTTPETKASPSAAPSGSASAATQPSASTPAGKGGVAASVVTLDDPSPAATANDQPMPRAPSAPPTGPTSGVSRPRRPGHRPSPSATPASRATGPG